MIVLGIQDRSAAAGLLILVSLHPSIKGFVISPRQFSIITSICGTDQTETLDLISDAGSSVGDLVTPWIDVEAGNYASSNTIFVITQNGTIASFSASGTTLNTHLTYNGTH